LGFRRNQIKKSKIILNNRQMIDEHV